MATMAAHGRCGEEAGMDSKSFTICLWFDTEGEEAARFYLGIFKDGSLGRVTRYSEAGPGRPGP